MLKNSLLVTDLDETVFQTSKMLLDKGYRLSHSNEDELVEIYIREMDNLIHAPVNEKVVKVLKKLEPYFDKHLVITARSSIPIDITLRQVKKTLGNEYKVFVTKDKGKLVNAFKPVAVFAIDDKLINFASMSRVYPSIVTSPEKIESIVDSGMVDEFIETVRDVLKL